MRAAARTASIITASVLQTARPGAEPAPLRPLRFSPVRFSLGQRLTALFDDWCEAVAPCPWTATAGRGALATYGAKANRLQSQPLVASRP